MKTQKYYPQSSNLSELEVVTVKVSVGSSVTILKLKSWLHVRILKV